VIETALQVLRQVNQSRDLRNDIFVWLCHVKVKSESLEAGGSRVVDEGVVDKGDEMPAVGG
jgi:hypothetical protein